MERIKKPYIVSSVDFDKFKNLFTCYQNCWYLTGCPSCQWCLTRTTQKKTSSHRFSNIGSHHYKHRYTDDIYLDPPRICIDTSVLKIEITNAGDHRRSRTGVSILASRRRRIRWKPSLPLPSPPLLPPLSPRLCYNCSHRSRKCHKEKKKLQSENTKRQKMEINWWRHGKTREELRRGGEPWRFATSMGLWTRLIEWPRG